jgi:hypothetical protein
MNIPEGLTAEQANQIRTALPLVNPGRTIVIDICFSNLLPVELQRISSKEMDSCYRLGLDAMSFENQTRE